MIDVMYKIEVDIKKVVVDIRAIIDAKWNKCLNELNVVKEAT